MRFQLFFASIASIGLAFADPLNIQYTPRKLVVYDEQGSTSVQITLNQQPTEPQFLYLDSDHFTFDHCYIEFNAYNWDVPQTLVVKPKPIFFDQVPTGTFEIKGKLQQKTSGASEGFIQYVDSIPSVEVVVAGTRRSGVAKTCSTCGDPHIQTFDGPRFDTFTLGAQWLVNNPTLKIQSLQYEWYRTENGRITVNEAFAIQYKDEFMIVSASPYYYGLDNQFVFVPESVKQPDQWQYLSVNIEVDPFKEQRYEGFLGWVLNPFRWGWGWGSHCTIRDGKASVMMGDQKLMDIKHIVRWYSERGFSDATIYLGSEFMNRVSGLCGNFDGETNNDLPSPNAYDAYNNDHAVADDENLFSRCSAEGALAEDCLLAWEDPENVADLLRVCKWNAPTNPLVNVGRRFTLQTGAAFSYGSTSTLTPVFGAIALKKRQEEAAAIVAEVAEPNEEQKAKIEKTCRDALEPYEDCGAILKDEEFEAAITSCIFDATAFFNPNDKFESHLLAAATAEETIQAKCGNIAVNILENQELIEQTKMNITVPDTIVQRVTVQTDCGESEARGQFIKGFGCTCTANYKGKFCEQQVENPNPDYDESVNAWEKFVTWVIHLFSS